jgi:hypothetical protein
MYEILRDNCLITLLLSVSTGPDGDLEDLLAESKDIPSPKKSVTSRGLQGGVTFMDDERPQIHRNDAIDMNWGPVGSSYLIFRTREGGHREPIRLRLTAPCTPDEFDRLDSLPISGPQPDPRTQDPAKEVPALTPERLRRHELLRSLRAEILAAEKWSIVETSEGNVGDV